MPRARARANANKVHSRQAFLGSALGDGVMPSPSYRKGYGIPEVCVFSRAISLKTCLARPKLRVSSASPKPVTIRTFCRGTDQKGVFRMDGPDGMPAFAYVEIGSLEEVAHV